MKALSALNIKKSSGENLEDFDAFKNVLIAGQDVQFDIWRYVDKKATKIVFDEPYGLEAFWDDQKIKGKDEHTIDDYRKIWTDGGIRIRKNEKSRDLDDSFIRITSLDSNGNRLSAPCFTFTTYDISIRADFLRNGRRVDKYGNSNWAWGKGVGKEGPVMKVHCKKNLPPKEKLCNFAVNFDGPLPLPKADEGESVLILQLFNAADVERIVVCDQNGKPVLGNNNIRWVVLKFPEPLQAPQSFEFYAYATKFPDREFDGLLRIGVNFAIKIGEDPHAQYIPIYREVADSTKNPAVPFIASVQFRVAPFILTPNTQSSNSKRKKTLFVSEAKYAYFGKEGYADNSKFIEKLYEIGTDNVDVIAEKYTRNDPWMQDEIKFGYQEMPTSSERDCENIVLNSPRNRGLDVFPIYSLFESGEFGYVTRGGTGPRCSLDSFGNLDVTPPVDGYPLGRIYFGGHKPNPSGREITPAMRDFLEFQGVQKPVELYTDWLLVGHVDEMMCFIPNQQPGSRGFKLALSSPRKFHEILVELAYQHKDAIFFEGKTGIKGNPMQSTVAELLLPHHWTPSNDKYQQYIDYNREILKKELNLADGDIIDIPAFYYPDEHGSSGEAPKASAYMPGMVNMVVYNEHVLIPKPFGPIIGPRTGHCVIEQCVLNLLTPLGLICHFIDDWDDYHIEDGEIHCGTNVLRDPNGFKWWELEKT